MAAVFAAHAVCRVKVEAAREDRQPHEQRLLGFDEQPVGPVDRRGEALLPGMRTARATAQEAQTSRRRATSRLLITRIRAAANSIASGRPSSRRQISATAPDRFAIEVEVRAAGPGPVGEQRGGILDGQRRDRQDALAFDSERFPAGSQHRHPRALPNDLVDQPRRRVQQMLTVVNDEQQFSRPQVLDHRRVDAETLLLLQLQRRRHRVAHRCTVVERCEFAEPRAVAEALLVTSRGLEGKPRLADSTDAGQCHKRALVQRVS